MNNGKEKIKIILSFAAIYIIWGTTYLAIKIGVEQVPPFLMATFRYLIAACVLLTICTFREDDVFKGGTANMLLGAIMLTLGQGILFWVEKYLSSGLTAVLVATLPLWYIVADKRNWSLYFKSPLTLCGICLGLAGILLLFHGQLTITGEQAGMTVIASLVTIGSCFCWAAGSLYYKYHHGSGSLLRDVGWQLVGGGLACLLVAVCTGEQHHFSIEQISLRSWLAVLYLALAGSIVAFIASYYLLSVRPASVVGTYAYVNPVIAVLLGYAIANETVTWMQVAGMVVILVSAYMINKVRPEH